MVEEEWIESFWCNGPPLEERVSVSHATIAEKLVLSNL